MLFQGCLLGEQHQILDELDTHLNQLTDAVSQAHLVRHSLLKSHKVLIPWLAILAGDP